MVTNKEDFPMKKICIMFLTVAVTLTAGMFLFGCDSVDSCPSCFGSAEEPDALIIVVPDYGSVPGECLTFGDCDKQPGKTVNCVNAKCVYADIICPEGFKLSTLDECQRMPLSCDSAKPEQDACVASIACDPDNGEWAVEKVNCDDKNDATDDTCDPAIGCVHVFTCGGNCMDDDPCTKDSCEPATGKCVHQAIVCPKGYECQKGTCEAVCKDATDCDDFNPCTINTCTDGKCQFPLFTCDDGKDATADYCQVVGGQKLCTNVPIDCNGSGDDSDSCTVDICKGGMWKHIALACGEGTKCDPTTGKCEVVIIPPLPACNNDADCDDKNPCTDEACVVVNGAAACKYIFKECDAGQACDAATGDCVELEGPDCPGGCDDKDHATLDICEAGVCVHHQPVSCGAGTFLNPKTGLCEPAVSDPTCENDGVECAIFEQVGIAAVAICMDGHWFVLQDCGLVFEGNYCWEQATGPACQQAK